MGRGQSKEVEFLSLSLSLSLSLTCYIQLIRDSCSKGRLKVPAPKCESVEPRNEHEPICGSAGGPLISLEEISGRVPWR